MNNRNIKYQQHRRVHTRPTLTFAGVAVVVLTVVACGSAIACFLD